MLLDLQRTLFEKSPDRSTLLRYRPSAEKQYRVQVFRNHSFEFIAHMMGAYLDYARMGVDFCYSGYDDSFSFWKLDAAADLVLIWIDATRYHSASVQEFINERVEALRQRYLGPVLIVPYGAELSFLQSGVTVWNLTEVRGLLGTGVTEERTQSVTGTALSGDAMLAIAKTLGLRYFPALLQPPMKAIVVDFDNTLYEGVLGEDGIENLRLTEGHRRLQRKLREFSQQGLFLCAVTKNDPADIQALLRARTDFPLQADCFTKIAASWGEKSAAMLEIEQFLHIGTESILFIDDNIGELTAMEAAFPRIGLLQAMDNADLTYEILSNYPRLFKVNKTAEDSVRRVDIIAEADRETMRRALSREDFLRSLEVRLTFEIQNPAQAIRISELANKTNQFIFNYKRYKQAEIEQMFCSPSYVVVTASLSDRLSDSGLIGVCVGKQEADYVLLEECFISCRALGRGIEDVIVCMAIRNILQCAQRSKLLVCFQEGPRNQPAETFVNTHLADFLERPAEFTYEISEDLLQIQIHNYFQRERE